MAWSITASELETLRSPKTGENYANAANEATRHVTLFLSGSGLSNALQQDVARRYALYLVTVADFPTHSRSIGGLSSSDKGNSEENPWLVAADRISGGRLLQAMKLKPKVWFLSPAIEDSDL